MRESTKHDPIKHSMRRAVMAPLESYCHLSCGRHDDFVEVTEWSNGEGFDVNLNDAGGMQSMSMTYGQLKAIRKLVKALEKGETR